MWHRTCYSDATNKAMVQRARCHLQEYLSSGTHREPGRMPVNQTTPIVSSKDVTNIHVANKPAKL